MTGGRATTLAADRHECRSEHCRPTVRAGVISNAASAFRVATCALVMDLDRWALVVEPRHRSAVGGAVLLDAELRPHRGLRRLQFDVKLRVEADELLAVDASSVTNLRDVGIRRGDRFGHHRRNARRGDRLDVGHADAAPVELPASGDPGEATVDRAPEGTLPLRVD